MTDTPPPSTLEPTASTATASAATSSLLGRTLGAGLVSFAAVAGLLVGVGRRSGTPWQPLNAAAQLAIGSRADGVWNFQSDVTPLGCLVVLVLSMVAGFAVACVTASRRTPYVILAAACVAAVGYFGHLQLAARTPGGLAALLSVGELRALYVTLGIALAVGIRLALLPHERSRLQELV
jgi:hypothetical protein